MQHLVFFGVLLFAHLVKAESSQIFQKPKNCLKQINNNSFTKIANV